MREPDQEGETIPAPSRGAWFARLSGRPGTATGRGQPPLAQAQPFSGSPSSQPAVREEKAILDKNRNSMGMCDRGEAERFPEEMFRLRPLRTLNLQPAGAGAVGWRSRTRLLGPPARNAPLCPLAFGTRRASNDFRAGTREVILFTETFGHVLLEFPRGPPLEEAGIPTRSP